MLPALSFSTCLRVLCIRLEATISSHILLMGLDVFLNRFTSAIRKMSLFFSVRCSCWYLTMGSKPAGTTKNKPAILKVQPKPESSDLKMSRVKHFFYLFFFLFRAAFVSKILNNQCQVRLLSLGVRGCNLFPVNSEFMRQRWSLHKREMTFELTQPQTGGTLHFMSMFRGC